MSKTTAAPKTAEQRREEMEALHECLAEQVATLRTSAGWAAYLAAARSFHHYSINNLLLIMAQRPDATAVAGYRAWRGKGRQVRKGEKSIAILAPALVPVRAAKKDDDDASGPQPAGEQAGATRRDASGRLMRRVFVPARVFDISQTDPIGGAPQMPSVARDLDAADEVDLYERTAAHFARQSITLRRAVIPGTANGFCRKIPPAARPTAPEAAWVVEVVIDSRRTGADAARTAVHEACHIAAGHLEGAGGDYVAHRGRYEVEAESAAFIVAALAGLDTSAVSTGYVAGWMETAKEADLKATAATALTTARTLAAALGLAEDEHAERAEGEKAAA